MFLNIGIHHFFFQSHKTGTQTELLSCSYQNGYITVIQLYNGLIEAIEFMYFINPYILKYI